jgi:hypothetical protein
MPGMEKINNQSGLGRIGSTRINSCAVDAVGSKDVIVGWRVVQKPTVLGKEETLSSQPSLEQRLPIFGRASENR